MASGAWPVAVAGLPLLRGVRPHWEHITLVWELRGDGGVDARDSSSADSACLEQGAASMHSRLLLFGIGQSDGERGAVGSHAFSIIL